MKAGIQHRSIRIRGIVQGVGFRPFVYALAVELDLHGHVFNDAEGVGIAVEGKPAAVETFLHRLQTELPPLARIDALNTESLAVAGYDGFRIIASDASAKKSAVVSPDMAVCDHCLAEMRNPADRRYGYWLINCTDCGPRYSITRTVPYDRCNTSMDAFEMCDACRAEYEDPSDRRYHAQPIGCHECGPKLYYREEDHQSEGEEGFLAAVAALKAGRIVAVKGLGGFHLMCDATDEKAVGLLRERKRRPSKPFAVMFPTLEAIQKMGALSGTETGLITSREKPIVIVRAAPGNLAASVAPGIDRLGVFLPYTPLHYRLFEQIDFPLVATSANLSDEPIIRTEEELGRKLGRVADGVLSHERAIVNACDDSVMQVAGGTPLMLRLARGFAPCTLTLPFKTGKKILAVGANQKNSIALAFDDRIILSPHIGDLGSLEAFEYFERTLETFKRFYDFEPDVVVCDKHPGYETAKWARELKTKNEKLKIIEVQHHHAHVLAGTAEFNIKEPVLAFAFDGTGYGDDKVNGEAREGALGYGTIWGGEVLRADGISYERVASLRPFSLLGGEKAVREPRRVALGLLFECRTLDEVLELDLPGVKAFSAQEIRLLHAGWQRGVNAPRTSSMGRLFDAVASLSGICQQVSYEGESGLLLEAAVNAQKDGAYPYTLRDGMIDWEPMLRAIIVGNEGAEVIASRFLDTLVDIMVDLAREQALPVLLTGGVFQNRTLLERLMHRCEAENISCYLPSRFPVNDGGIALGQVWYALGREMLQ